MTIEELRYRRWEPIPVVLNHELISRYATNANSCEIPAEVFLNLECQRVIDTLLGCSEQVMLASSSLEMKQVIPIGAMVVVSTYVSDLRCLKEQSFVTVKQDYRCDDQVAATLTQVMTLKA